MFGLCTCSTSSIYATLVSTILLAESSSLDLLCAERFCVVGCNLELCRILYTSVMPAFENEDVLVLVWSLFGLHQLIQTVYG
jgi:hypothetical protein